MLSPEGVEAKIREFRAAARRHLREAVEELAKAALIDLEAEGAPEAMAERLDEVEACTTTVGMALGAIALLETVRDAR